MSDFVKNKGWLSIDSITLLLSIIIRSKNIYINDKLNSPDIGKSQVVILNKLGLYYKSNKKINQETLAYHLQIDKASISRSIQNLVDKKLVKKEKDPENKRQNLLSLTDEGKKFADKIEQYEIEWENAICNNDMEYKEEFLKHIQYIAGESVKLVYKEDCNE